MTESWEANQKLVLSELQRLNHNVEKIADNSYSNSKQIEVLKVKSSILGGIGGMFTVFCTLIYEYFRK